MIRAILIIFLLFSNSPAFADEAEMPVTATIIVCPRDSLRQACERETRCCYLLEEQGEASDDRLSHQDIEGTGPPLRISYAGPTSR